MKQIGIAIVLGSKSDLAIVKSSGLAEILHQVGLAYEVAIISAHRNPNELSDYCHRAVAHGAKVFIGVAGMSAALPGVIASIICSAGTPIPVIGVPLPSTEFPDGQDALLSMVRMPPGMPVAVCGIGKSGLQNAALLACQIVALSDDAIRQGLSAHMFKTAKLAEYDVPIS